MTSPAEGPHETGRRGFRMLLAAAAFLGAVFGGIFWLVQQHRPAPRESAALDPEPTPAPDVFYERIGRAPPGVLDTDGAGKQSFTLELDLTDRREDAERLIDTLKARGVDAYYTPLSRSGKIVYRVRHGIYPDRDRAAAAQTALRDKSKVAAKVVRLQ